jgi:hypothetical protein
VRQGWQESDLEAARLRMGFSKKVGDMQDVAVADCPDRVATRKVTIVTPPQKRLYDSKWEETYAAELVLRKHAGLIRNYWYHPFSMWLPGGIRYKPDFMIEYPLGLEKRLEIVEVKGWSKNLRDGMTRLKIAAAIFDCYTWTLVKKRKGGGWDEEII